VRVASSIVPVIELAKRYHQAKVLREWWHVTLQGTEEAKLRLVLATEISSHKYLGKNQWLWQMTML
jgi:hypothetical protein